VKRAPVNVRYRAFFEEGCHFFSLTDSVCGTPRTKEFDFGPLRLELVRQAA
jgi:hypothetical protein